MKKHLPQSLSVPPGRWIAYAAAGTATSLMAVPCAEARIHYSGPVDTALDSENSSQRETFPLSNGAFLSFFEFSNPSFPYFNRAGLEVVGPTYFGSVRGQGSLASRLSLKDKVSQGPFTYYSYGGNIQSLFGAGNFKDPGVAFLGFVFYAGGGPHYGWARIKLRGAPEVQYIVLDYAWGDVGDRIKVGQTRGGRSAESAHISQSSLGLLALGGVGLRASRGPCPPWRGQSFERLLTPRPKWP